ncbi:hypothetical protein B0T22DRAFT_130461 [Podospora appendiculata]|uniref:Uncharacterized protein n=1 Tax=Podospora appendiculata TaxID=314037 RepID=A0AAE0X7X6_9PEZI|nr:hypothetical protein B0T22DRAFT_130461 [Podospora appendiculata]
MATNMRRASDSVLRQASSSADGRFPSREASRASEGLAYSQSSCSPGALAGVRSATVVRQGGEVAWAVPVGQARDAEAEMPAARRRARSDARGYPWGSIVSFWSPGPGPWTCRRTCLPVPTTARPGAMHRSQPPSRRHGPCHTSLMHRRYCSCRQRGLHALVLALAHELPAGQVPRSKTICCGTLGGGPGRLAGQGHGKGSKLRARATSSFQGRGYPYYFIHGPLPSVTYPRCHIVRITSCPGCCCCRCCRWWWRSFNYYPASKSTNTLTCLRAQLTWHGKPLRVGSPMKRESKNQPRSYAHTTGRFPLTHHPQEEPGPAPRLGPRWRKLGNSLPGSRSTSFSFGVTARDEMHRRPKKDSRGSPPVAHACARPTPFRDYLRSRLHLDVLNPGDRQHRPGQSKANKQQSAPSIRYQ